MYLIEKSPRSESDLSYKRIIAEKHVHIKGFWNEFFQMHQQTCILRELYLIKDMEGIQSEAVPGQ